MAGLYFEEFQVGQRFRHDIRRTVLDVDNLLFCALTYNPAAVHIDHHAAALSEFGKPLVNSVFTLGLVIGLSIYDTTLGTTVANLGMSETIFPKPVFLGDTIRAETVVTDMRACNSRPTQGIVTLEHVGINQRDEIVCKTRRCALMLKKNTSARPMSPGEQR
jgi:acyl dehydratase